MVGPHGVKTIKDVAEMLQIGQMDDCFLVEVVSPNLAFHEDDRFYLDGYCQGRPTGTEAKVLYNLLALCQDSEEKILEEINKALGETGKMITKEEAKRKADSKRTKDIETILGRIEQEIIRVAGLGHYRVDYPAKDIEWDLRNEIVKRLKEKPLEYDAKVETGSQMEPQDPTIVVIFNK